MSRPTHALYGTALALALGTAATVTHADSSTGAQVQRSLSVRYGDLSLDRPADVRTLYRRITTAADQVCGLRVLTGSNLPLPSYQLCFDQAVSRAVTAVASPTLTAYYQSLPVWSRAQPAALARR